MTKKLVVLADLGHLKAYRLEESEQFSKPRLRFLEETETQVTNHLSEEVTDQAGQYRKGSVAAGPSDLSDGENHHLDLERRRRALKGIVARIDDLVEREGAEGCYLAAAKEINQAIVDALDRDTQAQIEKNIRANLTQSNPEEVIAQFCD